MKSHIYNDTKLDKDNDVQFKQLNEKRDLKDFDHFDKFDDNNKKKSSSDLRKKTKKDLLEYKGVHYKKDKKVEYHEHGAHFKYQELYDILNSLLKEEAETNCETANFSIANNTKEKLISNFNKNKTNQNIDQNDDNTLINNLSKSKNRNSNDIDKEIEQTNHMNGNDNKNHKNNQNNNLQISNNKINNSKNDKTNQINLNKLNLKNHHQQLISFESKNIISNNKSKRIDNDTINSEYTETEPKSNQMNDYNKNYASNNNVNSKYMKMQSTEIKNNNMLKYTNKDFNKTNKTDHQVKNNLKINTNISSTSNFNSNLNSNMNLNENDYALKNKVPSPSNKNQFSHIKSQYSQNKISYNVLNKERDKDKKSILPPINQKIETLEFVTSKIDTGLKVAPKKGKY